MSEQPQSNSGLVNQLLLAIVPVAIFGTGVFLTNLVNTKPQEGSIAYKVFEHYGLIEKVERVPPPLDCPGFKQDMYYGDARQLLKNCGWFASTMNVMHMRQPEAQRVALDTGWTEAQHCIGTGLANCRFLFYKPNNSYLVIYTSGMNHIVDGYKTSWEPIPSP